MDTNQSCLTPSEWEKIRTRLLKLRQREGSKLMQIADADITMKNLVYFSFQNRVVKFYENDEFIGIVVFDVINDWWTDKKILNEVLILCLSDEFKGFGRIAVDKLEELAKQYDVDFIHSGCMFLKDPQVVSNLYLKKGYSFTSPMYVRFMKE